MRIAIFSDSHDNLPNVEKALDLAKERGLTCGFHLGDFCAPFTIELLGNSGMTWQCVWGNNDGDKLGGYKISQDSAVDLDKRDFREIEIEGRKLFLTHYPQIARMAALSGLYDACFFGHNHRYAQEIIGNTLLANPGELLGHRFKSPSFGVYDTGNNTFERVLLPA